MADTAEGSIEVDKKMAEVEEQIADAAEPGVVNTEKEHGNDQAVPFANLDTAETILAQECDSVPETAAAIEENSTELFTAGEGLDETSEPQSNKRKTEVDESSDESKRQKTEDAASSDALSGEISVTENSGENKNKDELETRSEVNEIHSTPGNDTPDISAEDQVKSCVEEPAIEMERKEDDSSENKENVIDETISNGATEKTAELAEEEPTKVAAAKTLEESELPVEAEPVSS